MQYQASGFGVWLMTALALGAACFVFGMTALMIGFQDLLNANIENQT
jgi:hypothetical protein